jgi:D-alanyl-D-alanine carboxypeptidase
MRYLPKSFVVHRKIIEAEHAALAPIAKTPDGKSNHLARQETVGAFQRMAEEAEKQSVRLKIIWAYRAHHLQQEQFTEAHKKHGKRGAIRWLAPPGYSEHQTGWALDIGDAMDPEADDNPLFERTKAFHWLKQNAHHYGFELSFPPANWQGVSYEPWHWRYVGTSQARSVLHPNTGEAVRIWGLSFLKALQCWLNP